MRLKIPNVEGRATARAEAVLGGGNFPAVAPLPALAKMARRRKPPQQMEQQPDSQAQQADQEAPEDKVLVGRAAPFSR